MKNDDIKGGVYMGFIRRLLGFKSSDSDKTDYEIEPVLVSPDVIRMNMESFRNSKVVRAR